MPKVIVGLGNPGSEYDDTRHNIGWWVVDRLAYDWDFPSFEKSGPAMVSQGSLEGVEVLLLKPTTYMNRSGAALNLLREYEEFDPVSDLLVVVDEVALDVGKIRFRGRGSAGGHNGLKSIEAALGSGEYGRLRIGVGQNPPGMDRADWVLSSMGADEEEIVLSFLPRLAEVIGFWVAEDIQYVMSRYNGSIG